MKMYYVYVLSSNTGTLYVGVTNDLERRIFEHKNGCIDGFTKKYHVHRLVYYECTEDVKSAIVREKEIKGWLRKRKIDLIKSMNPKWEDLSSKWFYCDSLGMLPRCARQHDTLMDGVILTPRCISFVKYSIMRKGWKNPSGEAIARKCNRVRVKYLLTTTPERCFLAALVSMTRQSMVSF